MTSRVAVVLVVLAAAVGCHDLTGPPFDEPIALVRLGGLPDADRAHRFLAVGLESRRAVGWSERFMLRVIGAARSPDGGTLFVTGDESGWRTDMLVALDTRTLAVRWREPLADSAGYRLDRFDGVVVRASHRVTVSPDGERIFIAGAVRDDLHGVAVLDARTRDLVGFAGGYANGSMRIAMVPQGPVSPRGALAVSAGQPGGYPDVGPGLSLFDAASLDQIDSLEIEGELAGEADGIADIVPAPDGRHLYLRLMSGPLLKYDLVDRRVEAGTPVAAPTCLWCMTVSPDGERVYLAESWTHTAPSSGIIRVYDADLRERAPIDLSRVEVPRLNSSSTDPPALNSITVAPDGTLLVATGAVLAQLWGLQSARVFFVDPRSHEVLGVVEQDGAFDALQIFLP